MSSKDVAVAILNKAPGDDYLIEDRADSGRPAFEKTLKALRAIGWDRASPMRLRKLFGSYVASTESLYISQKFLRRRCKYNERFVHRRHRGRHGEKPMGRLMWNYRVIRKGEEYGLYEVFYNDEGEISAHAESPILSVSMEDLLAQLSMMKRHSSNGNDPDRVLEFDR